jgi:hypothetical protein
VLDHQVRQVLAVNQDHTLREVLNEMRVNSFLVPVHAPGRPRCLPSQDHAGAGVRLTPYVHQGNRFIDRQWIDTSRKIGPNAVHLSFRRDRECGDASEPPKRRSYEYDFDLAALAQGGPLVPVDSEVLPEMHILSPASVFMTALCFFVFAEQARARQW